MDLSASTPQTQSGGGSGPFYRVRWQTHGVKTASGPCKIRLADNRNCYWEGLATLHFGFVFALHFPGLGAVSARAIVIVATVKIIVARTINKAFGRTRMFVLILSRSF